MNKRRILIVDDNAMIAKMMGVWLERTGMYETLQENKPLLGVSAARRFKPDLILLDVDMPEMAGPKVADALRHDPFLEHMPILFLTPLARKTEGGRLGYKGPAFIPKPVSPAELIDHVAKALAEPREADCR
jgi:two-component system cell cycle response regulator DivK